MKKLQLWCKAGKSIRIQLPLFGKDHLFFNQGMLLLGSNHFLIIQIIYQKEVLEGARLENWFKGEDY